MIPTVSNSPWTKYFYVSHILSLFAALGYILCAFFSEYAEASTVGEFQLNITHTIALIYYIASGMLVIASLIGFAAQKLSDKPSLWIMYCILMSILAIVELALAASSLGKVNNHKVSKNSMRIQMEDYVKEDSATAKRWDDLHKTYSCCGVDSYKEWQDVPFGRTTLRTPKSCCLPEFNNDTYCSLNVLPERDDADTMVFTRGCLDVVIKRVDFHMTIMGVFGMTVALIHSMFVSLSCFLVITKKV